MRQRVEVGKRLSRRERDTVEGTSESAGIATKQSAMKVGAGRERTPVFNGQVGQTSAGVDCGVGAYGTCRTRFEARGIAVIAWRGGWWERRVGLDQSGGDDTSEEIHRSEAGDDEQIVAAYMSETGTDGPISLAHGR